mmetsp:Transcript_43062/g.125249  ORF Transcript_43062/g.125249 Transcript_43062/m.125249 type:complete len:123 (+) Transcript_43062:179-547(+)
MKGMINFNLSLAVVEADASNPNVFMLRPYTKWAPGSTTDKDEDEDRVYIFDTTGSEHSREKWVEVLQKHMEKAKERHARRSTAKSTAASEYWEDETVDEEQALAAAKLVEKLEAKKRARQAH